MQLTAHDKQLIRLIQKGDSIEIAEGRLRLVHEAAHVRLGTSFTQVTVAVHTGTFILPIHSYQIRAVWRKGNVIWERDKALVQKGLWE